MELVQLRTFLAVLEHRGFRNAARHLYLSQPAVSRQVAELERSVGLPLLVRATTGVEPTAAGLALAEWGQVLLDDHAAALRRARSQPFVGRLFVGITMAGIGELTAPLLRHLSRSLPSVQISTYDLTMITWPRAMPTGTDLMLIRDPYDDDSLRSTVLLREIAAAGIPRRYAEADASRLTLDAFLGLPYARISRKVPGSFSRFWSLHDQRGGLEADFRGRPAHVPADAPRTVARGDACALGTPFTARLVGNVRRLVSVEGAPEVRTALVSAIGDRRPVIDAVHRESAWATRRLGPLVLPELADARPV